MKKDGGHSLHLGAFALAIAAGIASPASMAQEEGAGEDDGGLGIAFGGFLRFDAAYRTDQDENPNNLRGNPFNGVRQPRSGSLPIRDQLGLPPALADTVNGLLNTLGADNIGLVNDNATRNTPKSDNDWALQQLRGKFDLQVQFSEEIQLYSSIRTIYDLGNYDNWDPDSVPGADPAGFNSQKPEFFEYDDFESGGCLGYLEVCGEKYMADFTSLYLDFQSGPVLVRVGQQQIAWGQALFFRVFDVPNGLDLRRHLILDDALEEYADERVAAPGVRVTWQVNQEWEADAYAQMFQQTTFPNPNTPYNVIPAQFSIHETWADKHKNEDFNYGLRLRANFGNYGFQFIATQRWNHEGVFRWRKSEKYDEDVPGIPLSRRAVGNTPLEVDPSGVWSANEWFTYAGAVRLDGLEGLNTLIREFGGDALPGTFAFADNPGAASLFATEVQTVEAAAQELDVFFQLAGGKLLNPLGSGGGLRGHLAHEYFKEEIYGAGASYVVEAEPGSILDQLIINVETSYIPDRRFTEKSLSRNYIVSDESVSALVMEKYHRWFEDFPATYMVFQSIHKTESDLFGRHLGCHGGTGGSPGTRAAISNPDTKQCHPLKNGHTDVVLAFLQPFPNYIYRLSGAALLDVRGGLLVQGGFRWSPGNDLTFDLIYNYLDGSLYGDPNENIIETIDWADELVLRAAYQF
ncbi:MAG: DUF1302 family protein [Panacagrimonas sp.]